MSADMVIVLSGLVVLGALLVNLNLRSRWPSSVKIGAIVITTVFYFIAYAAIQRIQGWPSRQVLPQQFRYIASYVIEPNQQHHIDGAIYLWVLDPDAETSEPRAYALDYDAGLHGQLVKADERKAKGKPQLGERVADKAGSGEGRNMTGMRFFDAPQLKLPQKDKKK